MSRAETLRAFAQRMAAAGGRRLTVTPESAKSVASALEAYADLLSIPKADYPTFTVDVWSHEGRLLETIAWTGNMLVGRAAFEEATRQRPAFKVTLRQGIRVVAEHVPPERAT